MATISLYTTEARQETSVHGHAFTREVNVYMTLDDAGSLTVTREIRAYEDRVENGPSADDWVWTATTRYLTFAAIPTAAPTEAQRAMLAARYLDRAETRKPGAKVCQWAFAEIGSAQTVSDRYGDSRKIYLA